MVKFYLGLLAALKRLGPIHLQWIGLFCIQYLCCHILSPIILFDDSRIIGFKLVHACFV